LSETCYWNASDFCGKKQEWLRPKSKNTIH
jgi:hypothetical protein